MNSGKRCFPNNRIYLWRSQRVRSLPSGGHSSARDSDVNGEEKQKVENWRKSRGAFSEKNPANTFLPASVKREKLRRVRRSLRGGRLVPANGNELRDARLLHRDAVQHGRHFHRPAIMRHDDELCAHAHLGNELREAAHV